MANQIVLSWSVSAAGTSFNPAKTAAALAAVMLYQNPQTDPVLGQLFGLTVEADVTAPTADGATRTLTLNMTPAAGAPLAPPFFPCNPTTATTPVPPYELIALEALPGAFLTVNGSDIVQTEVSQIPSLEHGNRVQFDAQVGVFYEVDTVTSGQITLTTPYLGTTDDDGAAIVKPAPATIIAVYSTSPLDTAGVPQIQPVPIPPGSGAQTVSLTYLDSTGAGPFTIVAPLAGKAPIPIPLAVGSLDVTTILDFHVASTGAFGNSVGQITLCELNGEDLAEAEQTTTLGTPTRTEFQRVTDLLQTLIDRALVYIPPSYFALAGQQATSPQLEGDFIVTTGSANVPTTEDQTGVLSAGDTIQFIVQLGDATPFGFVETFYTLRAVSPRGVTLETPFTGINRLNRPQLPSLGSNTRGTISTELLEFPTAAQLISPQPATPPSDDQLAGPLAQFVNPGVAIPPPGQPLPPTTMSPPPTFLSGFFTQTIQLALAVPVTQATITLV
jgi:hypothetical protein